MFTSHPFTSHHYTVYHAPLPAGEQRYAVISDLHIGHPESRYENGWNTLLSIVGNPANKYSGVILNGDFTDFPPYHQSRELRKIHTDGVIHEIKRLLALPTHPLVTFVLGNHDNAHEFQHALEKLRREEGGERLQVCDAVQMGGAFFIHGDFGDHTPWIPKVSMEKAESRKRHQPHVENYEQHAVARTHLKLKELLGDAFGSITDVFFGHVHPSKTLTNYQYHGKAYHITGTALKSYPNSALSVLFKDGKVAQVKEMFSETAQQPEIANVASSQHEGMVTHTPAAVVNMRRTG